MEITPEIAYLANFPTTALTEPLPSCSPAEDHLSKRMSSWGDSILNPKNRIDSLAPVKNPKWRIDGCARMATQFYTIPTFFQPLVPIRIDTFISPRVQWSYELVEMLEIERAFLYYDSRVVRYGIAQHILRILEYWTSQFPNFQSYYISLPFGSRIVFENLARDVRQVQLRVVPMHSLERELLPVSTLKSMWEDITLPPILDIAQLELVQQLHDSISLVRLNKARPDHNENLIFKALIISPTYLYNELHLLLTTPPHPNIHPRPLHLVTKRCRFGGKTGVVGFTTTYHHQGTLRDILPFRLIHNNLRLSDQLKWAQQLTRALIHLRDHSRSISNSDSDGEGYHCDLRLDNILLSDTDDVLLIDFEHRGILAASAAPEVRALEYVDLIATHPSYSGPLRDKYALSFARHLSPYLTEPSHHRHRRRAGDASHGNGESGKEHASEAAVDSGKETKRARAAGCYAPWLALTPPEREAAEVFMLGRVLWCIFEGSSAPDTMLAIAYARDPVLLEFPSFDRTPPGAIRELVLKCTRGWTPWLGGLRRRGGRVEFDTRGVGEGEGEAGGSGREGGGNDVLAKTVACCIRELEGGEEFLGRWERGNGRGEGNFFGRPGLDDVLRVLEGFRCSNVTDVPE